MSKFFKNHREFWAAMLVAVLFVFHANASSIYSWSSGEVLTHSQLNANFAHIHNNMVGGHGARLVDADVASNAAISRSKIYQGNGMSLAWAKVGAGTTVCSAGTCTVDDGSGVSGASWVSTGVYGVVLSPAMSDSTYGVVVSAMTSGRNCTAAATDASNVVVTCTDLAAAAADSVFTVTVFDT